jgi:hypothetical protein
MVGIEGCMARFEATSALYDYIDVAAEFDATYS